MKLSEILNSKLVISILVLLLLIGILFAGDVIVREGDLTVNGNLTQGQGIIESGSNVNGSYIKYADGTMTQWAKGVAVEKTFVVDGAIYIADAGTVTFPQSFTDTNYTMSAWIEVSVNNTGIWAANQGYKTVNSVKLYAWCYAGSTRTITPTVIAIGRWK